MILIPDLYVTVPRGYREGTPKFGEILGRLSYKRTSEEAFEVWLHFEDSKHYGGEPPVFMYYLQIGEFELARERNHQVVQQKGESE